VRHLVRRQLAEQDGAGVVELRHRGGVLGRHPVDEDARVPGGEDAARVVDVLEPERDAVQRAAGGASRDRALGRLRLLSRQVERARDERVRLPVVVLDAADERIDQLDGRERARGDQRRELGDRQVVEIAGHESVLT
jgi:hypothetical protein